MTLFYYPAIAKVGIALQNLKKNLGAELKRVAVYNGHRVAIFFQVSKDNFMAIKQSTDTYMKRSHQKEDDTENRMPKFS